MAVGDLILTIAVVWGILAVGMGITAEKEGRSPWGWFIGTLLFGVFALFVYWATNPHEEEDREDERLSFIAALKYCVPLAVVFFLSLLLASLVSDLLAPMPIGVNFNGASYSGPPPEQIRSAGYLLRVAIIAPSLMATALGHLIFRYRDVDQRREIPPTEAGSVGVLVFFVGLWLLLVALGNIGALYSAAQFGAVALGGVLAVGLLILDFWIIGLGRSVANSPFPTS